VIHDSSK
ncbi:hypothetical protein SUGI_0633830, partial [Cryptomeria japonica]